MLSISFVTTRKGLHTSAWRASRSCALRREFVGLSPPRHVREQDSKRPYFDGQSTIELATEAEEVEVFVKLLWPTMAKHERCRSAVAGPAPRPLR